MWTAVCNLTGYLITIHIEDKKTMTAISPLIFGHHVKIWFTQNSTFQQWDGIYIKAHRISLPASWHKKDLHFPHHLQANGKLESSYRFIKDCICKFSIDGVLEWE